MRDREARCSGTRADGQPCAVPFNLVGDDGRCPAHREGAREKLAAAGRKGAEISKRIRQRKAGLAPSDLPPLRTPQDAETWLETLGRAVATGRLSNGAGQTAIRAVRAWLAAHEAGEVTERVDELREAVAELKGRGRVKRIK